MERRCPIGNSMSVETMGTRAHIVSCLHEDQTAVIRISFVPI